MQSSKAASNFILKNIKNEENATDRLEAHQYKASINVTEMRKVTCTEFIRFSIFFIMFFIVVTLQLPITSFFIQNDQLRKSLITKDIYIPEESHDLEKLLTTNLLENMFLIFLSKIRIPEQPKTAEISINKSFIPLTNVRLIQKRVNLQGNSTLWESPITFNKTSYGQNPLNFLKPFEYDEEEDGFSVFLNNFSGSVNIFAYLQFYNLTLYNFFDEQTYIFEQDNTLLNLVNDLVSVLHVVLNVDGSGLVKKHTKIITYKFTFYETADDAKRLIMEIIFIIIYTYYLGTKLLEVYIDIKNQRISGETIFNEEEIKKSNEAGGQGNYSSQNQTTLNMGINQVKNKYRKISNLLKQILFGIKHHLSNIWNVIDALIISLGLVCIVIWLKLNVNNSLKQEVNKIDYTNLVDENLNNLNKLNSKFLNYAYDMDLYMFLISKLSFILMIKLVKYLIGYSNKLMLMLNVLINIFDMIVFYILILIVCMLAFVFLYKDYIGQHFPVFQSLYSSFVFLFALTIGTKERFRSIEEEYPIFSLLFYMVYFFLLIFILSTFFLIIVKNELKKVENKRLQEKKKTNDLDDKFKYQPHFFWISAEKIRNIYLNIVYYTNRNKYNKIVLLKEETARIYENEINLNPNMDFDLDFKSILSNEKKDKLEYVSELEKTNQLNKRKRKIVKHHCLTFFVTLIFIIYTIIFINLFNSDKNFQMDSSIDQKIAESSYTYESYTLIKIPINDLSETPQVLGYIVTGFTSLFTRFKLPFRNSDDSNKSINLGDQYLVGYNFLAENKVRLTARNRKKELNETDPFFIKFNKSRVFPSFPYDVENYDNEEKKNFYSNSLNQHFNYSYSNSYNKVGGYPIFFAPNQNETFHLITGLYKDKFLRDNMNSIVLDFCLINPLSNHDLSYVKIVFQFDDSSYIIKQIKTEILSINRLKSNEEKTIFAILVLLACIFVLYLTNFIKYLHKKSCAYNSWNSLFVKNNMPDALIYHRERKKPELLRKILFLSRPRVIIEGIFFIFNFCFFALYAIYFYNVSILESFLTVMGTPLNRIDEFEYKNLNADNYLQSNLDNLIKTLNRIEKISAQKQLCALFASLSVFLLSFELILFLAKNKEFNSLLQAFFKTISELPYFLILYASFIFSFAVSSYFQMGPYIEEFKSVTYCFLSLLQMIYRVEKLSELQYYSFHMSTFFFLILVPLIILLKFLILNLFLSLIFRAYESSKNFQLKEEKNELGFKEFMSIFFGMLKRKKKLKQDKKIYELYEQAINNREVGNIYEKIKQTVESTNQNTTVLVWATLCAEEIKEEQSSRNILKEKCEEIVNEYFMKTYRGEFLSNNNNYSTEKKLIEYQIRQKYWFYLYYSNIRLSSFYQYFALNIKQMNEKLSLNAIIFDQEIQKRNELRDDKITKVYIRDLEKTLEENLFDIKTLNQSCNDYELEIEKLIEHMKSADISRTSSRKTVQQKHNNLMRNNSKNNKNYK